MPVGNVFDSFLRDLSEEPPPPPSVRFDGDLICSRCGYGVSTIVPPPLCPMCSGSKWEFFRPRRR